MDIFEKITKTGQDIADMAKDVYDVNKINFKICNEEKMLNRRYIALAKKYLKKYGDNVDVEFIEDVEKIDQHLENIEDYKLQKAMVKGTKMCADCGKPVDDKAGFCQNCGKKMQ